MSSHHPERALPEPEGKATKNPKVRNCCKKVVKFLFSHVGLVVMIILYGVAGAFLFELLERHEEVRLCEEGKGYDKGNMTKYRQDLLNYIQFNTSRAEGDHGDNETVANTMVEVMLNEYRAKVLDTLEATLFKGQDNCDAEAKWDISGGLLFCVTVFTTIGYGNIAPKTWEGQIVCICYAVIGIPLFLMCLANIGGVLGDMFRFVYARVCCRLCHNKDKKKDKVVPIKHNQAWKTDESARHGSPRSDAAIVDDESDDDDDDDEEEEEEEKVTVPLTVTMMIISGYIVAGAFLFGFFEGWQPIEAAYFCFVTLSTMGFGDYVPGQNPADKQKSVKLLIGAIYVVFGMATIGMCFELMQEEIIAKFTWIGRMTGIMEKPKEDDDDEDSDDDSDDDSSDESDQDDKKKHPIKHDYPSPAQGSQSTLKRRSPSNESRPPSYHEEGSRPSSGKKGPPPTESPFRQQSPQGAAVYRPARPASSSGPTYRPSPDDGIEEITETEA